MKSSMTQDWSGATKVPVLRSIAHTLINGNYALFMAGSFCSALGGWVQAVAIGWLVFDLTGSPFVLGLANFAQMSPLFFLGLIGGVLADRADRRIVLMIGLSVGTVAISILAGLTYMGLATVPIILLISLVLGLANAAVWPAWQPFIKELVPTERLREAIAFNSARFNLSRVLGPAFAGGLLASSGAAACLAVTAATSLTVVASTYAIRRPAPLRAARGAPWMSSLGEGLLYVREDRFSFRLLAVTTLFGLVVMPYSTFLPALARDVLHWGPEGLGQLLTAAGLGAVGGAVLNGAPFIGAHPRQAMVAFSLIGGISTLMLVAGARFLEVDAWIAWFALAGTGLGTVGFLTSANATLQMRIPDHLVGRVMGLWVVLNAGTNPLGSLALGWLAEYVPLTTIFGIGGMASIVVAGSLAIALRNESDTFIPA